MATTSFLKNVNLKGRKQCQSFIRALESASSATPKQIAYSKTVSDMDAAQILKVFGDAQCPHSQATSKSVSKNS